MENPVASSEQFVKLINKGFAETKEPEGKAVKVAYLGGKGSFTDVAARKFFSSVGMRTESKGFPSFEGVFSAVASGIAEAGVLPIESTWSGSFARCYDCLLKFTSISVIGEISVIDSHCLAAIPGSDISKLKAVHSHPDIFAQCSGFLDQLSQQKQSIERVSELDSASACSIVQNLKDSMHCAICSLEAAKIHGLEVLKESVANDSNSASRYIVVAAAPSREEDKDMESVASAVAEAASGGESVRTLNGGSQSGTLKCTIAITMHNEAQGLFKVLSCFALRGINVTKLDSRPSSSALGNVLRDTVHWEYVFFLDFEPRDKKSIDVVISNVREFCSSLRVIGVYQGNLKSSKVQPSKFISVKKK